MAVITLTIDLEDPSEDYAPDGRYVAMTRRILDFCDTQKIRATFFVVGRVAEAAPDLIKDIAAKGHEIAYHGHAHVPLTAENKERFKTETATDKTLLEYLAGKSVVGFRAPCFSTTVETMWALDTLKELGFLYSSSVMPTKLSRFGFAKAKRVPFRWPNGLIELPLPVADVFGQRVPYLGGIYLYALPFALVREWVKRAGPKELLWTYAHPYDFDREEGFDPLLHGKVWITGILWLARFIAERKIRLVTGLGAGKPLGERMGF